MAPCVSLVWYLHILQAMCLLTHGQQILQSSMRARMYRTILSLTAQLMFTPPPAWIAAYAKWQSRPDFPSGTT